MDTRSVDCVFLYVKQNNKPPKKVKISTKTLPKKRCAKANKIALTKTKTFLFSNKL